MTPPRGLALRALLGVCLLVGACSAARDDNPAPGTELLGPDQGEPVAAYLTRARSTLPAADAGPVWALVQLREHADVVSAAGLLEGVRVSRVVFRVPLPRVQTALVTVQLPGQRPADELHAAQRKAADEREEAGRRALLDGQQRAPAIAEAEAGALRSGCACVLALLVLADRAGLDTLAGWQLVRAVHAATAGTPLPSVAVSPLLPEQLGVVGPVPDDGPVSPSATR